MHKLFAPIVVDHIKIKSGMAYVIRDDQIVGGTKLRAAVPFIEYYAKKGVTEFVYASPFAGYAQIALAHACKEVGVQCYIYAEQDPQTKKISTYSNSISDIATIEIYPNLETAQEYALYHYEPGCGDWMNVPLGFNHPTFHYFMHIELCQSLIDLSENLELKEFWVCVGTGSFAQALRRILPDRVKMHCIGINVLPAEDHRLKILKYLRNTKYNKATENFSEEYLSSYPLDIPSNKYYDAKVWDWLYEMGQDGAIWWNIAGNIYGFSYITSE